MKRLLLFSFIILFIAACGSSDTKTQPEPHLVLGQRINFVGSLPEKIYIVAGYREQFEDKTDTNWSKQEYIVFTYFNDQGDYVQGVVHKDAIIKQ